jgi:glycosyltransferase involved in cell wall biosynthesis
VRLVVRPPLGAAGARNEGVRHARGAVIVFIDDDDVPISEEWLARHLENYAEPTCMGTVGRLCSSLEGSPPPRFPGRTYRLAATHTFWKDGRGFLSGVRRKVGIDYLFGTNCSVRRSLIDRIGGWDEGVPSWGEEHSFAFRFARLRLPGEHFVFDPRAEIWRRTDLPGGANRRSGRGWYVRELSQRIAYYHEVVGYYFPWRFRLLYPLYALRALTQVEEWIWDGDNRSHGVVKRMLASVDIALRLPWIFWREGLGRPRREIKRITSL